MTHKRIKKLHKLFTWFTVFSLVLQMGSGAFLYRPVFAEEPTPPETTVEETVTPVEEPAPVEEETPTEPVDEAPAEDPVDEIPEEPIEEVVEEEPVEEPTEEPVLTVEQEEVIEEIPEETAAEEAPIEEPTADLEEPEVAEESAELNPSVLTDKEDYAPGETVKITGENFPANTVLIIRVTRPDGSVVKGDGSFALGSDEITTDAEGKFEYHYQLNGIEGEYLVEVLQGEAVLASTIFADTAPTKISAKDHEGQKKTGGVLDGYTNGNVTEYTELDPINFRFTLDANDVSSGQLEVRFTGDDGTCLFFDGNFSLGTHDGSAPAIETISGTTPSVTTVGSPAPTNFGTSSGEWVQTLNISFSGVSTSRLNYYLTLTDEAGECTGSSQHSRLNPAGGDVSQTGQQNVPVPANQIIELPEITVIKNIDRDGDGSFESTASAGEYCFALNGGMCATTDSSGQVVYTNVVPDGAHTVTETQLDFSQGTYQFVSGSGTNCTFSGSTATATVASGTTATNATCIFNNGLSTGNLTVRKNLDTDGDGQVDQTDVSTWTWDLDGGDQNYQTGSTQSVSIGNHNISEDLQNGWHVLDLTCGGQSLGAVTAADIYVPAQGLECVFANSRDTGTITVIKNIDWDESGTIGDHPNDVLGATDWTWDIDGSGDYPTGSTQIVTTGSYTISEDQKPNYHVVNLTCDGTDYGNTESQEITIGYNEDLICTFVNAPDPGSISGVKFEDKDGDGSSREAGEPGLPDWTIEVRDLAGVLVASVQTGADGSYSIPDLDPGTYSVCEIPQPPDWTRTYPGADCYLGVVVGPGGVITDKDFGNFKNVDITVCKYIDTDADGTGDTPYTDGWLMTLNPGDTSQTTDGTGCTTFLDLQPGSYSVTEETKPGWTSTGPTTHDFGPVESGNQSYTWTFGNFQNVSVTACKLTDGDGDINTTGDQGVKSGWTVYLSIDGIRQTPGEQTGDTGCYTWTNLGPGHSYDVEEDVPSGWTALTPTSHNFGPAQSGDASYTYNFINFQNVTITVCKYNDIDGSGNVSAPDMPISGWEMTLHKDFQVFDSQLTGGNGCYVWNNMGPGFYQVVEEVKAGWINTVPTMWSWGPVQSGGNYRRDFTNRGALKICGTKYEDVDGSGDYSAGDLPYTAGWEISIYSAHMGADATSTDANGNYCFENLEPGDFTVTEEDRGGWIHTSPSSVPVTLTNQNETIDFFNFKCTKIWGYKWEDLDGDGIWDPGEPELDGWEIGITKMPTFMGAPPDEIVETGAGEWPDGYYEFEVCQAGFYRINEVLKTDWSNTHPGQLGGYLLEVTSGSVSPEPEDELGWDFGNFKHAKLSGYKVEDVDGDGDPAESMGEPRLDGWTINLEKEGVGIVDSAVTGDGAWSDGYYEFIITSPGTYTLTEVPQAGWVETYPDGIVTYTYTVSSGLKIAGINFLNFQLGKIQGRKYNDLNGDGLHDKPQEDRLNGWTVRLYDSGWNYLDEVITSNTGEIGQYRFEGLEKGTYYVCEVMQADWTQTGPVLGAGSVDNNHNPTGDGTAVANNSGAGDEGPICWETEINESGQTRGWLKFGNIQYGSIGDFVWEDLNNDTVQDAGEPGIGGVTVNLYLDDGDGTFEPGTDDGLVGTDTTDGLGGYLFENLIAGDYWVDINDITIPLGYILTTANDPMLVELDPGEDELGADFGYLPLPPEISIKKSNDKSGGASVGDTVNYTLTLNNGPVPVIVDVIDVLPDGFTYVAGSGKVDGALSDPSISGNTLTWKDLSFSAGQERIISYQAKIADDQPAGTYYNLATCRGLTGGMVDEVEVALSVREPQTVECEIVDSSVPITRGISVSADIGGTVLGITTERVLGAATGAPTILILLAILMIVMGLIIYHWKKIKSFGLMKILRGIILSLAFLIFATGGVQAGALKIVVADLPEYINKTDNLKLYYTALETEGKPITVTCYIKKDGGFGWRTFGSVQTDPSSYCQAVDSDFEGDGTYRFKAIATGPDGSDTSNETFTILDREAPDQPRDYRKERISSTAFKLYWRNPNNSDFAKVLVYRSEKQDFTADDSTKIGDRGGSPDQEMDYVDGVLPVDKEYFYAIRALDKAGNASGLAGDGGSVTYEETIVEITPAPGEVVILPAGEVKEEEGQILGGAVEEEEVSPAEEAGGIAGAVARITGEGGRGWLYGLGGFIILGIFGYLLYRRRS